ncbi:hypothetical protein AM1_1627 [Acaryochloris marina MBIC11017]|uniref:Uncharacterized protein n=1 Tax=Acaryochloris marina (strain MBIC 11017) TaxID=329726 RepID=B0CA63_ACAM1|nr:hypothetical protein AM1_1627 [Acaryochloris marina MBIC11017]BDM81438.1 hypothetical protein AM10699_43050 [Acaryochloris marina MBIC10699]
MTVFANDEDPNPRSSMILKYCKTSIASAIMQTPIAVVKIETLKNALTIV